MKRTIPMVVADAVRTPLVVALALLLAAVMAGCLDHFENTNAPTNVIHQAPVAPPTAVPTPPPSPVPGPGVSDVASMAIFVFGYGCPAGVPQPLHSPGIIEPPCTSADVTATPKQANGDDAVNHGNSISWTVIGGDLEVFPGPTNALFNRLVRVRFSSSGVRLPGSVTLVAELRAPDGRLFTASKVITAR